MSARRVKQGFFCRCRRWVGLKRPISVQQSARETKHMMGTEVTEASRTSLPLLAAQMGVWVAQKLEPASLMFNVNQYADIDGSMDVDIFESALRQVLAETEALRIKIVEQEGGVGQEVTSGSDWTLTYLDLA